MMKLLTQSAKRKGSFSYGVFLIIHIIDSYMIEGEYGAHH